MNIKNLVIVTLLTIGAFSCLDEPKFIATDTGADTKKDSDTGKDVADKPDVTEDVAQTECEPTCEGGTVCKTDGFTCVACLGDADCEGAQVCNTDLNTCVDCKDNSLCTDAATSTCTTGTCGACTLDDDCTHIAGLPRCDGACKVECEDDSHCDGKVCDVTTNTCTTIEPLMATQCESCVSDTQCKAGFHCIPLDFPVGTPHGNYCLKILGGDTCAKPFDLTINKISLNGVAAVEHCAVSEDLTTCEAVLAAKSDTFCGDGGDNGEGNADLTKCPANVGSLCESTGNKFRCTYSCNNARQCSTTCNAGNFCD